MLTIKQDTHMVSTNQIIDVRKPLSDTLHVKIPLLAY